MVDMIQLPSPVRVREPEILPGRREEVETEESGSKEGERDGPIVSQRGGKVITSDSVSFYRDGLKGGPVLLSNSQAQIYRNLW